MSRSAISRSSVDLPQPDGPMSETNSPAATVRSMSSSAVTSPRRGTENDLPDAAGLDGVVTLHLRVAVATQAEPEQGHEAGGDQAEQRGPKIARPRLGGVAAGGLGVAR